MHASGMIAFRHFLVNDPAACGHPLHVAGGNRTAISHAVAVLYGSNEDVCDGLNSAVRVPGKPCQIIFWNVIAKVIEKKKGIEVGSITEAEGASQVHPRALQRRLRGDNSFNRTDRHRCFLSASHKPQKPIHVASVPTEKVTPL